MKGKPIGRRLTKRTRLAGSAETLHAIDSLTPRTAEAAARALLRANGYDVEGLLAGAPGGGFVRERVLWVSGGPQDRGNDRDSALGIAATVVYAARQLAGWAEVADSTAAQVEMAFELGKLAVLAIVYEAETTALEPSRRKADAARRLYSDADKEAWREHVAIYLRGMTIRSSVPHVVRHFGLPERATETVRKALMKKTG